MDISFSDEFPCISAATSAAASSSQEENMFFYSVPTSPSFKFKISSLYCSDLDEDEFEFETSRRFLDPCDLETDKREDEEEEEEEDDDEKQKRGFQRKNGDSLPTMAFADELFCDGKVLPLRLPLKLPPRLQNGSGKKASTPSSTASLSPRSLGSSSARLLFSGQSFWNDDFDPFMVALKVARDEEKRGKPKARDGIRRTKSAASLLRTKGPNRSSEGHCGPCVLECEGPNGPAMPASRGPKMVLREPKGLEFARRARLFGLHKNGPNGPNRSKEERESGGDWTKKGKREKIMKFLFGKVSDQHKLKDQKDETVNKAKKMTLTCYKPRFLLCLGYGGRYAK